MGKLCAHKCVGNVLRNLDLGNIKIYLGENTLRALIPVGSSSSSKRDLELELE